MTILLALFIFKDVLAHLNSRDVWYKQVTMFLNRSETRLNFKKSLQVVGLLGLSYLGLRTLKIYLIRRRYAHIPGPRTQGLFGFYFGNLRNEEIYFSNEAILGKVLLKWHLEYGPVIKYQLGGKIIVSTTDPDTIKMALITENYPKDEFFVRKITFPFEQRFFGFSLTTNHDNEKWKMHRDIFSNGFDRNILMNFVDDLNFKLNRLIQMISAYAETGATAKIYHILKRSSLDAITTVLFRMQTDSDWLADCIEESADLMDKSAAYSIFRLNPLNRTETKKFLKSIKSLREFGKEQIIERSKSIEAERDICNSYDVLSGIMKKSNDVEVDLEVMVDNFILFLITGQESTGNCLSWCFLELAKNPKIMEKCQKEIDEIIGSRSVITFDDIKNLKYVGSVFKESLRLYPPRPTLCRFAKDEIDVCGLKVPKNTFMIFSTYVCGRLENNFENSSQFNPDRFAADLCSLSTNVSFTKYFPFSIGPRCCIGKRFAQVESIMTIVKVLQAFNMKLKEEERNSNETNKDYFNPRFFFSGPAKQANIIFNLRNSCLIRDA